ncbi:site-specific integrase [Methylobacterium sp. A49B]
MSTEAVLPSPTGLQAFAGRARGYADQARAENTRRAYASDVRAFATWCDARGEASLPARPAAVLAYLIDHVSTLKVAALQRRLAAIREQHAAVGLALDTSSAAFRVAWRAIKRAHGRPAAKTRPLMTADLRRAVATLPDTLAGRRDRAPILVGFAAALRRSELAGLEVACRDGCAWVEGRPDGFVIHLGRSKTDQQAEGAEIGVPYGSNMETCPVRSYRARINATRLEEGPAFRPIDRYGHIGFKAVTDRAVARIVQRTVEAAALAGRHCVTAGSRVNVTT